MSTWRHRHLHQWETTSEFDRPPAISTATGAKVRSEDAAETLGRLLRGTHVIVLRCKTCGDAKIVEG